MVPANKSLNEATRRLLCWMATLRERSDSRLLSGAFGGYSNITGSDAFSLKQADDIAHVTGKYPAVYGADYAHGWDTTEVGNEAATIGLSSNTLLERYHAQGGIIQISHHLPNPVFPGNDNGQGTGAYKTPITNAQFERILSEGSKERACWLRILDRIADGLSALQASNVPVLYRPLHEMNGNWFWWGATGYNANDTARMDLYQRLWRDLFDYFTHRKGLNNLIWVYSPDASPNYKTAYYPGEDYVDIAGIDMYSQMPGTFSGYDEMVALGKLFAFTEVGPSLLDGRFDYAQLVAIILKHYPRAAYFLPWNSLWSPLRNKNADACYNHAGVANRSDVLR